MSALRSVAVSTCTVLITIFTLIAPMHASADQDSALLQRLRTATSGPAGRLNADPDIQLGFLGARQHPFYRAVENLDAAGTLSTDEVWPGGSAGFTLDGSTVAAGRLGVWDAGGVRLSHDDFDGRAVQMDGASNPHYHSTHVAGTLIGAGGDPAARGMAYAGQLDCYDWSADNSEMAAAAANGMWLSNHSYGFVTGWRYSSSEGEWYWYGDLDIDANEDYGFGVYSTPAEEWDQIAADAPNYLIVKSAGNDRNDDGPGAGGGHYHWDGDANEWVWATDTHQADGADDGGYDTVSWAGTAKNILTVGAVSDIPGGWTAAGDVEMSTFSGWGPTDDGRIKPDLTANGIGLYSTASSGDSDYATYSGTSMAAPNAAGSAHLVNEAYVLTHAAALPTAALTKGILLHTTDEAGSDDGPDFQFGWGLMNTRSAVEIVAADAALAPSNYQLLEATLVDSDAHVYWVDMPEGGPLRVTLSWTDPAGTPPPDGLDVATPMLVQDLDLRVAEAELPTSGTPVVYEPWLLDPDNPSVAAATGDNTRDNVERLDIADVAPGVYEIRVTHKGTLEGGAQDYALVSSVPFTDATPATDAPLVQNAQRMPIEVVPNPFVSATRVHFSLPQAGAARVEVYDVQGRRVRLLHEGNVEAGGQSIEWDGRGEAGQRLAAGLYFVRIRSAAVNGTVKMIRLTDR